MSLSSSPCDSPIQLDPRQRRTSPVGVPGLRKITITKINPSDTESPLIRASARGISNPPVSRIPAPPLTARTRPPSRNICPLLLAFIVGICMGAICVLLLHESKQAKPLWEPLHRQPTPNTWRHLSHYHSGAHGEGREESVPDDDMDEHKRQELEARIFNETLEACGPIMVAHKQWYILNHARHPEPVTEAEALAYANKTGETIARYGTAVNLIRWWGNAYYHGALQVLPYGYAMSLQLKHELPHLQFLSILPHPHESILGWLGYNQSLSIWYPPMVYYVEKLYHMDMIQEKITQGHINMPCITSFRGALWRQYARSYHYDPQQQYIVVANRLGTRAITNYERLMHSLHENFPHERFVRQYGDERIQDIRDAYMGAKAIIYSHGANSANIHLFAPPHRTFIDRFHIGNAAHRLYPTLVVEITWDDPNGNVWRSVESELGIAGHSYHSVRINSSSIVAAAKATKKPIPSMDEFLQNSVFTLESHHIQQIITILRNHLQERDTVHVQPS